MLRFGDIDPSVYSSEKFYDPELRRLEKLIEIQVDRDLTAGNRRGATVFIESNGESLQASVTSSTWAMLRIHWSDARSDGEISPVHHRSGERIQSAGVLRGSAMSHLNPQVATLWRALSG